MTTPDSFASGLSESDHALDDRADVHGRTRRQVGFHFEARQREEIIDQPRHARRLVLHDLEEMIARRCVVPGRPPQGLDEAGDRGQRRAQFMAGVGDEIRAHAVDPPRLALILEYDDEEASAPADGRCGDPIDALDGDALDIIDDLGGRAARTHTLDRRLHLGRAEFEQQRHARPERAEGRAGRVVGLDGDARRVEDDQRIVDRGGEILGGQSVEPAAVPRSCPVGLALAARAPGGQRRHDQQEQHGGGCKERRTTGIEMYRENRKHAGGKRPAVLRQPPGGQADETPRLFFPSGVGHRTFLRAAASPKPGLRAGPASGAVPIPAYSEWVPAFAEARCFPKPVSTFPGSCSKTPNSMIGKAGKVRRT